MEEKLDNLKCQFDNHLKSHQKWLQIVISANITLAIGIVLLLVKLLIGGD